MMEELEHLAHLWQRKKENICKISDPVLFVETKNPSSEIDSITQRYKRIKICPSKAKNIFRLDDLWRPLEYGTNEFISNPNDTVMDKTNGLIWQKSGCSYPLNWHQANKYIGSLNNDNFGGHNGWSLPTINELISLLTQTPHGEDFCIQPLFDQTQKWLWSCDLRSFMAAWYVNVELGFVAWHDFTGYYYTRGVCRTHAFSIN
jgi:hypothetical protein